jgi:hypothetical protein
VAKTSEINYTSYFSEVISLNGKPNLNTQQFKRFMNIVYLEAKNNTEKLKEVTQDLLPELLYIDMISKSYHDDK